VDGHPFRDAPARRVPSGRVKAGSRLAKFIALGGLCLLWNSVIWFIVTMTWGESIALTGFLSLFVIAGLAVFAAAVHAGLALLNPTVELYVSEVEPALGEMLDVRWHLTGKPQRLRKLLVELVAVEEATYRRGTDTTTDRHVFVREQLAHTDLAREIRDGTASVRIPHTVPTFKATNNRIVWKLAFAGDIPRWPDIDDEFELVVVGHKQARKAA
jgi:hypothetical protein